jgi:prophage DNA circulation protein
LINVFYRELFMADGETAKLANNSPELRPAEGLLLQGSVIVSLLVQMSGSMARLEQRVDGVGAAVNGLETTVAGLTTDVKDLVHWKNKVWGMVILLSWLGAGSVAAWAVVGSHISWTSEVKTDEIPAEHVAQKSAHAGL